MDTQKIVSAFRLSEWGGIVKERISSGQTVSAFCSERGISETTYYNRLKRAREAACKEIGGAQASGKIADKTQGLEAQSKNEAYEDIGRRIKAEQL